MAPYQTTDLTSSIAALNAGVVAIAEPTAKDSARDFLIRVQERLDRYRETKLRTTAGKLRADRSLTVLEVFGESTTRALEAIYANVEKAFIGSYREINQDDESAFTAKLTQSIGKPSFNVDFYGRGHFPPGAYHSEGHQDGMGLCLLPCFDEPSPGQKLYLWSFGRCSDVGRRRSPTAVLQTAQSPFSSYTAHLYDA